MPIKPPSAIVLWDLEHCYPVGLNASDAASTIRKVAGPYGRIKKIAAFWDSRQPISAALDQVLQDLQREGVVPIDCSFLGDTASTENAMLSEMYLDALDSAYGPLPNLIVLSSSSVITYAANKLRNRSFRVVHLQDWSELEAAAEGMLDAEPTSPSPAGPPSDVNSPTGSTSSVECASLTLDVPPEVARKYHVLIEVLQEHIRQDKPRISRADIGNLLVRHSASVYRDAGFGSSKKAFKDYIAGAENRGVIRSGGGGNAAYISLNVGVADGFDNQSTAAPAVN